MLKNFTLNGYIIWLSHIDSSLTKKINTTLQKYCQNGFICMVTSFSLNFKRLFRVVFTPSVGAWAKAFWRDGRLPEVRHFLSFKRRFDWKFGQNHRPKMKRPLPVDVRNNWEEKTTRSNRPNSGYTPYCLVHRYKSIKHWMNWDLNGQMIVKRPFPSCPQPLIKSEPER